MHKGCPRCSTRFGLIKSPSDRAPGPWWRRVLNPVLICRSCGAHCRLRHHHPFIFGTLLFLATLLLLVGGSVAGRALWPQFTHGWHLAWAAFVGIAVTFVAHWRARYELSNEP